MREKRPTTSGLLQNQQPTSPPARSRAGDRGVFELKGRGADHPSPLGEGTGERSATALPTTVDRRTSILRSLVWFACACLISIVLLEYSALLGLAFAALGGVGLGILVQHQTSSSDVTEPNRSNSGEE